MSKNTGEKFGDCSRTKNQKTTEKEKSYDK
jgi:hypothetical protein